MILNTVLSTLAPLVNCTQSHHEIMLNLFPTSYRSAWRKFFALKEEEEEAQGQQTQLEHEEGNSNVDTTLLTTNNNGEQNDTPRGRAMLHSTGPVQSEESIRARNQFVKESQRRNAHCENVLSSSWAPPATPSPRENEILQRPNIEIPVNGIPCTIAQ